MRKKAAAAPVKPKRAPRKVEPAPVESPQLGLTPLQQRFVDEYLVDLNGTQAAIRAGYSVVTAEQIAYQLLQKTSVWAAITAARKAQQERTQVTVDRVVGELALIALAKPQIDSVTSDLTKPDIQKRLEGARHAAQHLAKLSIWAAIQDGTAW